MNKDKGEKKRGGFGGKSKDDVQIGECRDSGEEIWAMSELVHVELALYKK